MSEFLQYVGQRGQLREDLLKLEISGKSHVESLRKALNPLASVPELDPETIMQLTLVLVETINQAKEVQAKIAAINNIIGNKS